MKVDIPYMDSMGMFASSRGVKQHSFRFAPESCSGDFFLMDGHSNRTNVLWWICGLSKCYLKKNWSWKHITGILEGKDFFRWFCGDCQQDTPNTVAKSTQRHNRSHPKSTHTQLMCQSRIWPFCSRCSGYFMAREEPPRIQLVSPHTLPKFNSSPLKSYGAPIGKANVFQTPFVQGRAVKLWRGIFLIFFKNNIVNHMAQYCPSAQTSCRLVSIFICLSKSSTFQPFGVPSWKTQETMLDWGSRHGVVKHPRTQIADSFMAEINGGTKN